MNQNLIDFINSFSDRLINLPSIEKNLKIQQERLRRSGNSVNSRPLNIEPIVLNTGRYGIVELQKTGIAVRDSCKGSIQGWVVSFNLLRARDPEKYAEFHRTHEAIVEWQILGGLPAVSEKTSEPVELSWSKWDHGCLDNVKYKWATSYAEKQACFDYMAAIMVLDQERYGLNSVASLSEWFFDYRASEYLMMLCGENVIGLLRLHLFHEIGEYTGLEEELRTISKDGGHFADAGAYFHKDMRADDRLRYMAELLGRAFCYCEERDITNLYAQVPKRLKKRYQEFGFRIAGSPFRCEGWQGEWVPVWLKNWDLHVPVGPSTDSGDAGSTFVQVPNVPGGGLAATFQRAFKAGKEAAKPSSSGI